MNSRENHYFTMERNIIIILIFFTVLKPGLGFSSKDWFEISGCYSLGGTIIENKTILPANEPGGCLEWCGTKAVALQNSTCLCINDGHILSRAMDFSCSQTCSGVEEKFKCGGISNDHISVYRERRDISREWGSLNGSECLTYSHSADQRVGQFVRDSCTENHQFYCYSETILSSRNCYIRTNINDKRTWYEALEACWPLQTLWPAHDADSCSDKYIHEGQFWVAVYQWTKVVPTTTISTTATGPPSAASRTSTTLSTTSVTKSSSSTSTMTPSSSTKSENPSTTTAGTSTTSTTSLSSISTTSSTMAPNITTTVTTNSTSMTTSTSTSSKATQTSGEPISTSSGGSDPVSNNISYSHQLLSAVETQIQQMQRRILQLETNMFKMQKESTRDPTVAFHVYMAKEIGSVPSAHVVFDTVLLNIGNAYSPLHGIFLAPYNGTYMFSVTAVNPPGQYLHCYLKKNDKTEEFIFAGSSEWDQNTRTTVLALNVNDAVWVEAIGYITGSLSDDGYGHIHMHSSFSGFLIKEM